MKKIASLILLTALCALGFGQAPTDTTEVVQKSAIRAWLDRGVRIGVVVDYGQNWGNCSTDVLNSKFGGKLAGEINRQGLPAVTNGSDAASRALGDWLRSNKCNETLPQLEADSMPTLIVAAIMNGSKINFSSFSNYSNWNWRRSSYQDGETFHESGTIVVIDVKHRLILSSTEIEMTSSSHQTTDRLVDAGISLLGNSRRARQFGGFVSELTHQEDSDPLKYIGKVMAKDATRVRGLISRSDLEQIVADQPKVALEDGQAIDGNPGDLPEFTFRIVRGEFKEGQIIVLTFRNRDQRIAVKATVERIMSSGHLIVKLRKQVDRGFDFDAAAPIIY